MTIISISNWFVKHFFPVLPGKITGGQMGDETLRPAIPGRTISPGNPAAFHRFYWTF